MAATSERELVTDDAGFAVIRSHPVHERHMTAMRAAVDADHNGASGAGRQIARRLGNDERRSDLRQWKAILAALKPEIHNGREWRGPESAGGHERTSS